MSLVVPFEEIFNEVGLLAKAPHWERIELKKVVSILNGYPLSSGSFSSERGFPLIRIRDLKFNRVQTFYTEEFPKEYIVSDGDLLVGMDGDFLCYEWTGGPAALNQRVCKLVPNESLMLKRFLFYGINGYLQAIQNVTSSVTVKHLSSIDLGKIPFPLPPLPEQHRIVAKLDALMQNVESNKQRLDKIPKLLKRFRQSVLAAAVDGTLTASWRIENRITENWEELVFSDCLRELKNGLGKKPDISPPGIPILRISALRAGFVDLEDIRYYTANEKNIANFYLKNNDILFTRYNGSIDFLGVCGLVRNLTQIIVYPDKLMRVRLKEDILHPAYCEIYFQSETARNEILKYAKSSAGQNGISGGDLKKVNVICPTVKEQKEITRRVEQLFYFADKVEARYINAKAMLDKLPQSILAKAFRGELVPQDPEDEPARVLLERIRAERRADPKTTRKTKSR